MGEDRTAERVYNAEVARKRQIVKDHGRVRVKFGGPTVALKRAAIEWLKKEGKW